MKYLAILVFAGFLIWYLYPLVLQLNAKAANDLLFCDAETVLQGKFITNGHYFTNGNTQSDHRAYSGRHSCFLPGGDGIKFGFGMDLKSPMPGQKLKVSVWVFNEGSAKGLLTLSANDPKDFYSSTSDYTATGKKWLEKKYSLKQDYQIAKKLEQLKIYVYSDGYGDVYFDDLLIEIGEGEQYNQANEFNPPTVNLRLSEKAIKKIKQKREKAFEVGLLFSSDEDWVNGRIEEGDQQTPVKLRLKGDILDHLEGEKWSFRVKTKGETAWNRLQTFSVQNPRARDFLDEWVLHQFFEKEDVLTPRYDFFRLKTQ